MDLVDSDRVQETLDHAEDAAESPRRIDDVELAEAFGVVVLTDGRGLADVAVDTAGFAKTDALEVHDGAARLEEVTGKTGAGGEAWVSHFFVLADKVGEHAVGSCDFIHCSQVDLAELFNVDGTAVLGRALVLARVGEEWLVDCWRKATLSTYLVDLVVILRIVFGDLVALLVVEGLKEVVYTTIEFLSPFLALDEPIMHQPGSEQHRRTIVHLLGQLDVKLPCS